VTLRIRSGKTFDLDTVPTIIVFIGGKPAIKRNVFAGGGLSVDVVYDIIRQISVSQVIHTA
jgi:hypothetical protein